MRAIALLTATTVILRLELLPLLGSIALQQVALDNGLFWVITKKCISIGILALSTTVSLDSYFWKRWPLWPEGVALVYNVVEGKSKDWGVSPWHFYATSSLPKILTMAYPLAILSFADSRCRLLLAPTVAFIAALSFLHHKEWRFIVYVIPTLNLCSCVGLSRIPLYRRLAWSLLILSTLAFTTLSTVASSMNYPGGFAMKLLHSRVRMDSSISVHIDTYAAMTGASQFTQLYDLACDDLLCPLPEARWTYDKTEDLGDARNFLPFDYLLTSQPMFHQADFEVLHSIKSYAAIQLVKPSFSSRGWFPLRLRLDNSLWIMKRKI